MRFFWNAEISWKGVLTHYLIWTSPQSCPDISLNPEVYHNQTKQTDFYKSYHPRQKERVFVSLSSAWQYYS